MAFKILFLGVILAIYVANTFAQDSNCVNSGGVCNEHSDCCNKYDKCFSSLDGQISRCAGDGLLGGSCNTPIECSRIVGATCENGICACRKDHTEHNRHLCQPVVRRFGVRYVDRK